MGSELFFYDPNAATAPGRAVYEGFRNFDSTLAGHSRRASRFTTRALDDPEIEEVEYDDGAEFPGGDAFWVRLGICGTRPLGDRLIQHARDCRLAIYDPQVGAVVMRP